MMRVDKVGGRCALRHLVTGEVVHFGEGHDVVLRTHQKRAFVEIGGESTWVSKLFKKAVFECVGDSRRFVFERRGDGFQCTWEAELQRQHDDGVIALQVQGPPIRCASVSYMAFRAPRPPGPCRVFWNLRSVQEALQLGGLSERQRQVWIRAGMDKTWRSMLGRFGCGECDQLEFYGGQVAVSNDGLEVATMHPTVSTRALILLFAHWSRTMEARDDRGNVLSVFTALVEGVCVCRRV